MTTPPKDCRFLGFTFTFKLSVQKSYFRPLSGGCKLRMQPHWAKSPHQEQAPVTENWSSHSKKKSSSTSSPPTPLGSSCRYSTLLLMLMKESQGDLHPGKILRDLISIYKILLVSICLAAFWMFDYNCCCYNRSVYLKVEGSSMCQGADAGQHANCEQERPHFLILIALQLISLILIILQLISGKCYSGGDMHHLLRRKPCHQFLFGGLRVSISIITIIRPCMIHQLRWKL